jgi:hypothetical protein
MNKLYEEIAESLIFKIAKNAGFTNDIRLFEGKMGVAILLFHASRYFASKELKDISESLIDDIIEEEEKLYELCNQRESDMFWALNYLFDCGYIDFEEDFFDDMDELLFPQNDCKSQNDTIKNIFMGNYIISRHKTSKNTGMWNSRVIEYLNTSINTIYLHKELLLYNLDLLTPFWYTLLYWDKKNNSPFCSDKLEEILLFFNNHSKVLPHHVIIEPKFQFFITYNKFETPKHIKLGTKTISSLNAVYLNKLLYPNYIMPTNNQIDEILSNIINNKDITRDLFSLLSFQNIGLKGYFSGLAWTLLQFLQSNNEKL